MQNLEEFLKVSLQQIICHILHSTCRSSHLFHTSNCKPFNIEWWHDDLKIQTWKIGFFPLRYYLVSVVAALNTCTMFCVIGLATIKKYCSFKYKTKTTAVTCLKQESYDVDNITRTFEIWYLMEKHYTTLTFLPSRDFSEFTVLVGFAESVWLVQASKARVGDLNLGLTD